MVDADYDAVVVGAGAGGAAAAWRLTQRGWRVLLLDAGPAFDPETDYGLDKPDWEKERFRHKPGSLGETRFAPLQRLDPALADLRSWSLGQGFTNRATRRAVSGPGYHHVRGIGGSTLHFVGESHRLNPASMAMKSRHRRSSIINITLLSKRHNLLLEYQTYCYLLAMWHCSIDDKNTAIEYEKTSQLRAG